MSNKLYIPELGDEFQLTKDWTFDLYGEYRNTELWIKVTGKLWNTNSYKHEPIMKVTKVTLNKDTVLAVDRIYIRKGAAEYSSISFRIISNPIWNDKKVYRFWAKLADCNNIEFTQIKDVTKEIKITKWDYILHEVNKHYTNLDKIDRPLHNHIKGYAYIKDEKVLKMSIKYDIEWIEHIINNNPLSIFGIGITKSQSKYWTSNIKNVKYALFDMNDIELGRYNTFGTAKKNANKFIADLYSKSKT